MKERSREDLKRSLAREQGSTTREHDSRSQQKGVSQWSEPRVADVGGGGRSARWPLD